MLSLPDATPEEEPQEWAPTLDDQLRVMRDHWQKTGRTDMPKDMSRSENLLRRILTPKQITALPLHFEPDPTAEQSEQGMISAAGLEYNAQRWSILPLIYDLKWEPVQLAELLRYTPPDKPVKLEVNPVILCNIYYHSPEGPVPVKTEIPPDKLYNTILEALLPHFKEE